MTNQKPTEPAGGVQLDLDFVRAQFPALTGPQADEWIHLENAGGSYLPTQVTDLWHRYLTEWRVQPYGPAGPAQVAGEAMDRARRLIPATFGLATNDENGPQPEPGQDQGDVHFGPSTSQNTYVLARAIRATLETGDEVIVTNQDHEANIGAWRRLAETGLTVREWSVDSDQGLLDVGDLEALITDRTRLVCVTHASNLSATINPISEVADLANRVGALVVVDGVSWAPHAAIDVTSLGCDIYLYSAYKTYGPHQGLFWTRAGLAEQLANQGHWFNAENPTARLSPAGPDHGAIAACAGMVDYYDELYRYHFGAGAAGAAAGAGAASATTGSTVDEVPMAERIAKVFDLVADHEERLMAPLLDFLVDRGVRILGSTSRDRAVRAPTIAFDPGPVPGADVVEALAAAGIGVGFGDFYARRLAEAVGLADGVVRISAVHYNTVAEIDRTIDVLDQILAPKQT